MACSPTTAALKSLLKRSPLFTNRSSKISLPVRACPESCPNVPRLLDTSVIPAIAQATEPKSSLGLSYPLFYVFSAARIFGVPTDAAAI